MFGISGARICRPDVLPVALHTVLKHWRTIDYMRNSIESDKMDKFGASFLEGIDPDKNQWWIIVKFQTN